MERVKNTDGFHVYGWIANQLELNIYELVAYSLVHQFSQSKAGIFTGGVAYVAEFSRCSMNMARKTLQGLEKKGLIKSMRGDNGGVPYCHYQVTERSERLGKKAIKAAFKAAEDTPHSVEDTHPPQCVGSTPHGVEGEMNNKENTPPAITKVIAAPPSKEEVAAYAREKGFADPEGFAEYYIDVQTENGWTTGKGKDRKPVSNWKLNVLAWRPYHRDRIFSPSAPASNVRNVRTLTTDELNDLMK